MSPAPVSEEFVTVFRRGCVCHRLRLFVRKETRQLSPANTPVTTDTLRFETETQRYLCYMFVSDELKNKHFEILLKYELRSTLLSPAKKYIFQFILEN